jgi:hypothetical protein
MFIWTRNYFEFNGIHLRLIAIGMQFVMEGYTLLYTSHIHMCKYSSVKQSNFRAQHIIYPSNLLVPPSLFSLPRFMENKTLHYYIMSFFKSALWLDLTLNYRGSNYKAYQSSLLTRVGRTKGTWENGKLWSSELLWLSPWQTTAEEGTKLLPGRFVFRDYK